MKITIYVCFFIVVLFLTGCQTEEPKVAVSNPDIQQTQTGKNIQQPMLSKISITFSQAKELYYVGDSMRVGYNISGLNSSVKRYLLQECRFVRGVEKEPGCSFSQRAKKGIESDFISPFSHYASRRSSGFFWSEDSFPREGEYVYEITVYNCDNILEQSEIANCGRGEYEGAGRYEYPNGQQNYTPILKHEHVVNVSARGK